MVRTRWPSLLPLLLILIGIILAVRLYFGSQAVVGQAEQPGACRMFPETGKTVCAKFLTYWVQHGGLSQFGYPISNTFVEVSALNNKPYTVQYFERAVFEMHPENQPPYDVLLSQLGTYRFKALYPSGEPAPSSSIGDTPTSIPASRTPTHTPVPFRIVTVDDLPIYPGAQNVQKTSKDQGADFEGLVGTLTFDTTDTTASVFAYYTEVLTPRGWNGYQRSSTYMIYLYGQGSGNPVYAIDAIAQPNASNTSTNMQLTLTRYNHP